MLRIAPCLINGSAEMTRTKGVVEVAGTDELTQDNLIPSANSKFYPSLRNTGAMMGEGHL